MKDNIFTIPTKFELIDDLTNEEFASISLNPSFQWAKIIVTDDQPNANKVRIPLDEFDNLIKSGIFSPIKMAEKKISDGHDEAFGRAIGTISQLTKEGNKIIALAALWKKERPEEIQLLKEMYMEGNPPNVSWEIGYADSSLEEDVEVLKGTILNGLTVVGMPAYKGRTPFVAMSSKQDKEEFSVEELELLKQKVLELEQKLSEAQKKLEDKDAEFNQSLAELETLRTYKAEKEKKAEEEKKLETIRNKFVEAKIEKDDEYFSTNREKLLALSDEALDFMVQELVVFSSSKEKKSSDDKTKVPDLKNNTNTDEPDPKELAKALRDLNK